MTTTVDRPHLSRPFEARDICQGRDGNCHSEVGGPCCISGWEWWVEERIGGKHHNAVAFSREICKINGGAFVNWNDSTDPEIVAAELNRIARKVGLLPKG
jgi:hypothetical protein